MPEIINFYIYQIPALVGGCGRLDPVCIPANTSRSAASEFVAARAVKDGDLLLVTSDSYGGAWYCKVSVKQAVTTVEIPYSDPFRAPTKVTK